MSLFSLSGGLVYHARALRYRAGLWASFRSELSLWLERCLPPAAELILVGPSGAHCLPLEQLRRFGRLVALEPDPLARRILKLRLPRATLELEHRDLLLQPLLDGGTGLDSLLERRPMASVLFCNLLGQVQLELPDQQQQRFQAEFRRRVLPQLAGRAWASFHDRWSLDRNEREAPPPPLAFERLPSDDELGVACFGPSGPVVTAFDHDVKALFPEAWPRRYFGWQLTPQALHVVEGVSGAAAQLGSVS